MAAQYSFVMKGLSKTFPGAPKPVLNNVHLQFYLGTKIGIVGPNGSGKTTLLRTLAGLAPPLSGRIEGPEAAYASHADGIKATLTVEENLAFWADLFGQARSEAVLDEAAPSELYVYKGALSAREILRRLEAR